MPNIQFKSLSSRATPVNQICTRAAPCSPSLVDNKTFRSISFQRSRKNKVCLTTKYKTLFEIFHTICYTVFQKFNCLNGLILFHSLFFSFYLSIYVSIFSLLPFIESFIGFLYLLIVCFEEHFKHV